MDLLAFPDIKKCGNGQIGKSRDCADRPCRPNLATLLRWRDMSRTCQQKNPLSGHRCDWDINYDYDGNGGNDDDNDGKDNDDDDNDNNGGGTQLGRLQSGRLCQCAVQRQQG